jgi:hypothetical protein
MALRIAWTTESYSGDVPTHLAQRRMLYDSVSGQIFTYSGINGVTSGIYSTNFVFLDGATKVATDAGGTSSANNSSAPDYPDSTAGQWNNGDGWSPGPPGPSDRHPDFTTCIDTTRNKIVQVTGLAIGHTPNDFWEFSRNADPTDNRMTEISTSGLGGDGTFINGVLVHDPLHDVFWARYGNGTVMVLARTASISSDQSDAGCVTQNAWEIINTSITGDAPPFSVFNNAIWDPLTEKILVFSWDNGGGTDSDTNVFAYDVTAQHWDDLDPANKPTNEGASVGFEWLVARIPSGTYAGKFLYVRTSHTYVGDSGQAAVFIYDSQANTWTTVSTTGSGPHRISMLDLDPNLGTMGGLVVHEALGGQSGQFLHGILEEDAEDPVGRLP